VDDPSQSYMQYLNLSDELIGQSSKGLIAEAARVLALMVAGYQARFGEIAMDESLRLLQLEQPKEGDARMLASGLETLAGVLGALREETRDRGLH